VRTRGAWARQAGKRRIAGGDIEAKASDGWQSSRRDKYGGSRSGGSAKETELIETGKRCEQKQSRSES
jgi:hypothetical protein